MREFEQLIEIIQSVRKKITDDADVIWTPYENSFELQREIDKELEKFQNGNLEALKNSIFGSDRLEHFGKFLYLMAGVKSL